MIASIAGLTIEIGPDGMLSPAERGFLQSINQECGRGPAMARLQVMDSGQGSVSKRLPGPAEIVWDEALFRIGHAEFSATVDPLDFSGVIKRSGNDVFPLRIVLRVLVSGTAPFRGLVPMHAAGVANDWGGVMCFGPSGAGKTTISRASCAQVVSDELTFFSTLDGTFSATGLLETDVAGPKPPLLAMVALGPGAGFDLRRLGAREAFRKLLDVTMVPFGPPLWKRAVSLLADVAQRVPIYHLSWSPMVDVWSRLHEALDRESGVCQAEIPQRTRSCA